MRKKLQKIICIISCLLVLVCFCGCSNAEDAKKEMIKNINNVSLSSMKSNVKIINDCYGPLMSDYITMGSGEIYKIVTKKEGKFIWFNFYILTNNHVVVKAAGYRSQKFEVYDYKDNLYAFDGEYSSVELVCKDPTYDLAVLLCKGRIHEDSFPTVQAIRFNESGYNNRDVVFAVGQPNSQVNTLTVGKILNASIEPPKTPESRSDIEFNVIMHDAYIYSGSSGGMLLNSSGELIGINYAGTEKSEEEEEFYSYAIPIEKVKEFLEQNAETITASESLGS